MAVAAPARLGSVPDRHAERVDPIRTVGLGVFAELVPQWNYLDAWARGAIFITRLPEFAFGMALAAWAHASPDNFAARLQSGPVMIFATLGYAIALALSAFLIGNGVAIFLPGAGAFILLYTLFENTVVRWRVPMRTVRWLSDHTYSIFLVHFTVLPAVIPYRAPVNATLAMRTGLFVVGSVAAALLLEVLTARGRALAGAIASLSSRRRWQLAGGAAAIWLLLADRRGILGPDLRPAEGQRMGRTAVLGRA
jgi:peptidoglycan/LPS O-acetylase OafA/YrhL